MLNRPLLLFTTCAALLAVGCQDDDRDVPHAPHPNPTNTASEPLAQPVNPQKTEQQNKVAGAPPNTATSATSSEVAESAPGKPVEQNKVSGSPSGDTAPLSADEQTPPGKPASDGKDATP